MKRIKEQEDENKNCEVYCRFFSGKGCEKMSSQ